MPEDFEKAAKEAGLGDAVTVRHQEVLLVMATLNVGIRSQLLFHEYIRRRPRSTPCQVSQVDTARYEKFDHSNTNIYIPDLSFHSGSP